MTLQDEFGIITRNAERRAMYGNRVSHGRTAVDRLPTVNIIPATMKLPKIKLAVAPPARPAQSESPTRNETTRALIARVLNVVANVTGATVGEMQGLSVAYRISRPRQLAYALLRSEAKASLTTIGHHMGGKDHTSVRTGVAKTRMRLAAGDPLIVAWMAACQEQLASK